MKKILLDGKIIENKTQVFDYIKTELDISQCFANNLDGLWDVLSVYDNELEITLVNVNEFIYDLKGYGESFIELFNDLEIENANISFIFD